MEIFMKTMFSSISRLFFAYSKFIVMVTMLSGLSTVANSSEATYLKCDNNYYRLTGTYLESNYNIRTKKFNYKYTIYFYGEDYISFDSSGNKLNRNNGEWTSNGKVVRICKKISRDELPKLNQEGKLF
tara:strand:- start:1039 stop:1422 length:384 start_codon:yes stop_codon:yes gene_type:complete